ncbi:hypothetical protein LOK49_LG11G01084 [Camellia lanceoleosa]|uniref:Uncharacterized protein n=1 Tax=Camellia lanceoleosa TaxID=1840588 RepID=A0ACC0G4K3_9ERIC|nr:hypothetical protein LOK49_LG11G01084 [Camellia lanceoleosa]
MIKQLHSLSPILMKKFESKLPETMPVDLKPSYLVSSSSENGTKMVKAAAVVVVCGRCEGEDGGGHGRGVKGRGDRRRSGEKKRR